jgi:hypothetical protein
MKANIHTCTHCLLCDSNRPRTQRTEITVNPRPWDGFPLLTKSSCQCQTAAYNQNHNLIFRHHFVQKLHKKNCIKKNKQLRVKLSRFDELQSNKFWMVQAVRWFLSLHYIVTSLLLNVVAIANRKKLGRPYYHTTYMTLLYWINIPL